MKTPTLAVRSQEFLDFLEKWQTGLPTLAMADALPEPGRAALIAIVTDGFCTAGWPARGLGPWSGRS